MYRKLTHLEFRTEIALKLTYFEITSFTSSNQPCSVYPPSPKKKKKEESNCFKAQRGPSKLCHLAQASKWVSNQTEEKENINNCELKLIQT
jgi:hypothetical protein